MAHESVVDLQRLGLKAWLSELRSLSPRYAATMLIGKKMDLYMEMCTAPRDQRGENGLA